MKNYKILKSNSSGNPEKVHNAAGEKMQACTITARKVSHIKKNFLNFFD